MQDVERAIQATLAQLGGAGAGAADLAEKAMATWRAVELALSPVIGARAVQAIRKRSVYLIRADHPWLAPLLESTTEASELAPLQALLSRQTSADVLAANSAMLRTFCNLLATLIGESLTRRLLSFLWDHPSGGHAAQDSSP